MHLHPHVEPVDIIAATLAAHIQLYTLQKNLLVYLNRKVLFLNKPHIRHEDYKPYLPASRQNQLPVNKVVPLLEFVLSRQLRNSVGLVLSLAQWEKYRRHALNLFDTYSPYQRCAHYAREYLPKPRKQTPGVEMDVIRNCSML